MPRRGVGMFLFNVGIEHESDTTGQRLINKTIYASPSVMRGWQEAIEREFAKDENREFADKMRSLYEDVAMRKTDAVLQFIMDGAAGLKELEELRRSDWSAQDSDKRTDAVLYKTALAVLAIFKCFENNWTEPLRLALEDKRIDSKELRDCIAEWIQNTDKILINSAIKERNLGLAVDFLASYSNSNATGNQLIVSSIIDQCYKNSWRALLEKYLEKEPAKYPNFRGRIESCLGRMGGIIERGMESEMRQRKRRSDPVSVVEKPTEKGTAKR